MSAEFTPAVYQIIRERSGGICEVCGAEQVWDAHHRHPRKSGGTKRDWIGLPSNALGVCRHDHNLIESRRHLSRLLGWLVPEGFNPAAMPVMYRGAWMWVSEQGHVEPIEPVEDTWHQ